MKYQCDDCGRIVNVKSMKRGSTCKACGGTFSKVSNGSSSSEKTDFSNLDTKKIVKISILSFFGLMIVIALFNTFYVVQTGERAIVLTFGNPDMVPKSEGLHVKLPFVQRAIVLDIKTQKYETDASAASNDLQVVSTKIAINYHLSPESVSELYKTIGVNYGDRVIQPAVQEVVKSVTAKYTAEQLITRRSEVKEDIKFLLSERLTTRNILVEDISIVNFDFSESFNRAIEEKVTAEQNALQAKNKLEQIKYEAEQKVVSAKAEAESLALQKAQVTTDLIELRKIEVQRLAIEKWNGVMPTTLLSGDSVIPTIPIA